MTLQVAKMTPQVAKMTPQVAKMTPQVAKLTSKNDPPTTHNITQNTTQHTTPNTTQHNNTEHKITQHTSTLHDKGGELHYWGALGSLLGGLGRGIHTFARVLGGPSAHPRVRAQGPGGAPRESTWGGRLICLSVGPQPRAANY